MLFKRYDESLDQLYDMNNVLIDHLPEDRAKKLEDFMERCEGYDFLMPCQDRWLKRNFKKSIPVDIEERVRLDPLEYVDDKGKIISGFARKLINWEIE